MPHATVPEIVDTNKTYGDWRDDLYRDGYVVVKGVIPQKRCDYYIDKMFEWVERFPWGFSRNDRSTWTEEHLPTHIKGGMYHGYRTQHEKFMWEARTEPGVLDVFTKIWGTDKLLASFDGMNFTLPAGKPLPQTAPWPHIDQHPNRTGLQCVQGILNFAPNGPDDGGLLVTKGSSRLMPEFFKTYPGVIGRRTWGTSDWFGFEEDEVKWFEERGCTIHKVCAEPGDILLWDSRTMHHNCVPQSQNIRSVIYACYTPVEFAEPGLLEKKAEIFDKRLGTTHWPHDNLYISNEKKLRLGEEDPEERDQPVEQPILSDRILQLAGKLPY